MKCNMLWKTVAASVILLGTAAGAHAQANTFEVAAGGGLASYHSNGNSSNKGQFSASASYNILSQVAVGFEYAYTPISSQTASGGGYTASVSEHLNSFGGVARFGLLKTVKAQPYIVVAGGGVKDTASGQVSGGGVTYKASASDSGSYFGFGAGANFRLGKSGFGARPEVRYHRVSLDGTGINELNITGSLFYTFGGRSK